MERSPIAANAASALGPEDVKILRRMAGAVIGPSAELGLPGADDERIASRLLASVGARHGDVIRSGVCEFSAVCASAGGVDRLADSEFLRILRDFAQRHTDFAWRFLMLTTQAYYQDARIVRSLGMEPRPPFPEGNKVGPSDWSLLEPVKARGVIYRKAQE